MPNRRSIYLDHNATPLSDRKLEAMISYLKDRFRNPSSFRHFGQEPGKGIEEVQENTEQRSSPA